MVELRKRKASQLPSAPPAKKKVASTTKGKGKTKQSKPVAEKAEATTKNKEPVQKKDEPVPEKTNPAVAAIPVPNGNPDAPKHLLGYTIDLENFGGEIQTQDEKKSTLAQLVENSKAGVVLFTYPKASTPGCTNQVCLFRDSFAPLSATGLSIYGLSNDSPKANTTFKQKQNLPYTLLSDPQRTLIEAIGMKSAKGTQRGVFVVDKNGKVLAKEAGSPAGTVDVVRGIVKEMPGGQTAAVEELKQKIVAETAAEVADVAATMDRSKTSTPLPSQAAHIVKV